jgi:hypothetical protein
MKNIVALIGYMDRIESIEELIYLWSTDADLDYEVFEFEVPDDTTLDVAIAFARAKFFSAGWSSNDTISTVFFAK